MCGAGPSCCSAKGDLYEEIQTTKDVREPKSEKLCVYRREVRSLELIWVNRKLYMKIYNFDEIKSIEPTDRAELAPWVDSCIYLDPYSPRRVMGVFYEVFGRVADAHLRRKHLQHLFGHIYVDKFRPAEGYVMRWIQMVKRSIRIAFGLSCTVIHKQQYE